ncbi:MAG: indolepyruvate ferredoxin oxidoreductase subunit alpha [Candidatus Thorarchaeota archaeon]
MICLLFMVDIGSLDLGTIMMSGNEAIARGALEAGVRFCTAYPGTPSTEIMEALIAVSEAQGIYTEWSTNEKVALEAAAGASWMGVPALCSMKSLGLNVAADFLLNVNLSGTGPGGLVIVVCDDPQGHSSSNEQDSRFYAKSAYLPLIEPSTCQDAKDVIPFAYDISQRYGVPVIVRSTTRLSHSRALVHTGKLEKSTSKLKQTLPEGLYNVPHPDRRHQELDEKRSEIHREFEASLFNSVRAGVDSDTVIIASGVGYRYALEAIELLGVTSVDIVKLVTTYPMPLIPLLDWTRDKKRVLFIEEVDPFVEEQALALFAELELADSNFPTSFHGKRDGTVPFSGELNTDIAMRAVARIVEISNEVQEDDKQEERKKAKSLLIPRPLTFCAGCTHRNVYWAIKKIKKRMKENILVAGDIGCYSLGVFYDVTMETMQAMGSGIGVGNGLGQLHKFGMNSKVIAVAGDSTFFHSCIPALVNARHKNANLTFLVLDNKTTAMTGFQTHPGAKHGIENDTSVSIRKIVDAIDPDLLVDVDGTDIDELTNVIQSAVGAEGLKVVLIDSICRLEEKTRPAFEVFIDDEKCQGSKCKICVSDFRCTALSWDTERDRATIIEHTCIHCGACIAVCPHGAIQGRDLDE